MLDERTGKALQTRDERNCVIRSEIEGSKAVCFQCGTKNSARRLCLSRHRAEISLLSFVFSLLSLVYFSACSDYEDMYQDAYGYLLEESNIDYAFFIDDRDNQFYKTIKIGSQTWMAENLHYEYKVNKKVFGNFENSKYPEYGRYYTWAAAMDSAAVFSTDGKGCGFGKTCSPAIEAQGVCPEGWHLPTKDEFVLLWKAVGGQSSAGVNLKFRKGWENNGDGNNSYGFSALPAGGYYKQTFLNVGENAAFWSASAFDRKEAYFMDLHSSSDDANWNNHTKEEAYSVRCLKNVKSSSKKSSSSSAVKSSSSTAKLSSSEAKSSSSTSKSSSSVVKSSSSMAKSSSSNKVSSSSAKTASSSSLNKVSSSSVKSASSSSSNKVLSSSTKSASSSSKKVNSSSAKAVTSSAVVKSSSSKNVNLSSSEESGNEKKSSSSSKVSWAYLNTAISYGEIVDDRDKQVYKTVKIGDQTWMAENLNYKTTNSYCRNDKENNCNIYGRLYKWNCAVGYSCGYPQSNPLPSIVQGICPTGWHIPNKDEWDSLLTSVGGFSIAGKMLKTTSGWKENGDGMDAFGFSAIPAGGRSSANFGSYSPDGNNAGFWSSTHESGVNAFFMGVGFNEDNGGCALTDEDNYFSVRCIKD